ncbi:hypothetical protein FHR81_002262 [Actinoalloteichus hoggarensis]|uniref:DUF7711 domain-containing protein n=1 Tax=Actinoalloteichus hoggarensis TaxID=1470176 RepID=A0A221W5T0_9PSEU|nr:hypothetical protein [Actinoalloteichus hoggarensis]ASO21292.1 hypothetical protein AHOG_18335 [Actinoalloteichus hoggarensis]MBB5921224.1 hypothetical protein [Actinoalloteichus hoggarensis]
MKWTRAVWHLENLAESCADMAARPKSIFPLRVEQLWVFGDVLGAERDLDEVSVALAVDLPADAIPWLDEPSGAQHWGSAVRLPQSPIVARWRSVHAPVWNHRIDRPALLWDSADGIAEETLAALRDGRGESVRTAAVPAEAMRARLDAELALSLHALRDRGDAYADRRWKPGKLEPVADALWRVGAGYLDVLEAVQAAASR